MATAYDWDGSGRIPVGRVWGSCSYVHADPTRGNTYPADSYAGAADGHTCPPHPYTHTDQYPYSYQHVQAHNSSGAVGCAQLFRGYERDNVSVVGALE